jgi:hypothetical protein
LSARRITAQLGGQQIDGGGGRSKIHAAVAMGWPPNNNLAQSHDATPHLPLLSLVFKFSPLKKAVLTVEKMNLFEPNNGNVLYEKRIPLTIKKQQTSEEVQANIKIIDRQGALEVTVIDEGELFYKCLISERDFGILKAQQNLFVDFHQFPSKLMELLDQCTPFQSFSYSYPQAQKMVIQLAITDKDAVLNVVETNSFRAISHLSLRMEPPTEEAIRRHLWELINLHKSEASRLKAELANQSSTQGRLREAEQTISRLHSELDHLRRQPPQVTQTNTWERPAGNAALEGALASVQGLLDSTRRELSTNVDTLRQVEHERDIYRDALIDLEGQDRVRDLQRRHGLGATARSKSQSSPVVSRLEDNVKRLTDEINKGNDIIRRMQQELRSVKSKLKVKNVVVLQQEKLLEERLQTIEMLQKDLNTIRSNSANHGVSGPIDYTLDLERKLKEAQRQLAENANVIDWLQKSAGQPSHLPPLPQESRSASLGLHDRVNDHRVRVYSSKLIMQPKDHVFRSKYVPDSVFL